MNLKFREEYESPETNSLSRHPKHKIFHFQLIKVKLNLRGYFADICLFGLSLMESRRMRGSCSVEIPLHQNDKSNRFCSKVPKLLFIILVLREN